MMKEILNQDAQSPQKARLLFLTDLAAWMLLLSVFLPYMPGDRPIVSVFHTSLAFCAALLFFLVLLALDLKYYLSEPERFSRLTAALLGSCLMAFLLFFLSGFLISSALEIFCTVFAAQWLYFFYRKTKEPLHNSAAMIASMARVMRRLSSFPLGRTKPLYGVLVLDYSSIL